MKILLSLIAICLTGLNASLIQDKIDCNKNAELVMAPMLNPKLLEVRINFKTLSNIIDNAFTTEDSSSVTVILNHKFYTVLSSTDLLILILHEVISQTILQTKSTVITI